MSCRVLSCSLGFLLALTSTAFGQEEATIFPDSTAQVVRGFGAANIVQWRPDMTESEIETAFGVGEGKLGFSILRLRIPPDQGSWSLNVPTAKRAHEMGAVIIAAPWTPPASMKTNNDLVGGELREDMYQAYADYLDDFVTYMESEGVPIYAVSVQNEPDVVVTYESCDWSPEQMRKFMAENAGSISTRVMAPESFQFRKQMSDPLLNDSAATANLDIVAGHIYGGGLAAYPLAEGRGKELWMTEHLELETDAAASLQTARDMQYTMRYGMSAYVWWYMVRFYGPISDGQQDEYRKGEITKRGYMMSQFSRFIRPGFIRVNTEGPNIRSGVTVSAYTGGGGVIIVAVNTASTAKDVNLTIEGGPILPPSRYVTSATQDVEELDPVETDGQHFAVTLGAQSVTTFVANYAPLATEDEPTPADSYQLLPNYPNPFHTSTTIGYSIPQTGEVSLEVFDLLGRRVSTLARGLVSAGSHEIAFEASGLSPGMYVYRLNVGDAVRSRLMTITD